MPQDASFTGNVPVRIALGLLASLRDLDTPDDPEALAESDLPLNLRRRLGLSSVVVDQIRRYEQRKGDVSATEVASLFELIGRRPDATEIFIDAGRRIARDDLADRNVGSRLALRMLPAGLRRRRAWGRIRRLARKLSPSSVVRIDQKRVLVIERGLPASAVEGGVGCALLDGAIHDIFQEYRAGEGDVLHTECEGWGGDHCSWEVANAAAETGPGGEPDPPAMPEASSNGAGPEPTEVGPTELTDPHAEPVAGG